MAREPGRMTDQPDDALTEEEQWCESKRKRVIDYLRSQGIAHGRVGEWPAWHVDPYVSIWAIESLVDPESVGYWVIAGDLPTDYVLCGEDRTPRGAMRDFSNRWKQAAAAMAEGRTIDGWHVGKPENANDLAPLLASRAERLARWVDDDDLWHYEDRPE
jgi:hypothetical protein